jgi:hypothetical protein
MAVVAAVVLEDRLEHRVWRAAQNERPPREHVVDALPPVDIPDARPLPACHDEQLAINSADRLIMRDLANASCL